MLTVSIEVAKAQLHELIEQIQPGEELTITEDGRPVAQLKKAAPASWPSKAGSYKKPEFWMAPDFDAPLDQFKEYME